MVDYQICNKCIMDTSDPNIIFDQDGVCDYCNNFETTILPGWHTDERGMASLLPTIDKIKNISCFILWFLHLIIHQIFRIE